MRTRTSAHDAIRVHNVKEIPRDESIAQRDGRRVDRHVARTYSRHSGARASIRRIAQSSVFFENEERANRFFATSSRPIAGGIADSRRNRCLRRRLVKYFANTNADADSSANAGMETGLLAESGATDCAIGAARN